MKMQTKKGTSLHDRSSMGAQVLLPGRAVVELVFPVPLRAVRIGLHGHCRRTAQLRSAHTAVQTIRTTHGRLSGRFQTAHS